MLVVFHLLKKVFFSLVGFKGELSLLELFFHLFPGAKKQMEVALLQQPSVLRQLDSAWAFSSPASASGDGRRREHFPSRNTADGCEILHHFGKTICLGT